MVFFVCNACQETLKLKALDNHGAATASDGGIPVEALVVLSPHAASTLSPAVLRGLQDTNAAERSAV
jgi:hypothetical protein